LQKKGSEGSRNKRDAKKFDVITGAIELDKGDEFER